MNFRFAIISDPHVAVPQTIDLHSTRFSVVEISLLALEQVFSHLEQLDIDFLLLPGDLTQDGELDNHRWLQQRLAALPFPVYVVPGNHDIPSLQPNQQTLGFHQFPDYYYHQSYRNLNQLYYTCEVLPGVQLIGLNSTQFNQQGKQIGCLDENQLAWLEQLLPQLKDQFIFVMVHHNVIEHLPGQANHELGKRYMLDNANLLLNLLKESGCQLIFTGHLHVQDIAYSNNIYEITTGSLVSYPHPYRIIEVEHKQHKNIRLNVTSHRVNEVPGWDNLAKISRERLGDRSFGFMMKLLTSSPLNVPVTEAEKLAPHLRYFWADIAHGDSLFDFPHFPASIRHYFQQFGAIKPDGTPHLIDNHTTLYLSD
ncbi:metallophosphoesterase [Rippkaea orientalis PCC 8801]|uniref:Metallophosphoesterase n=1 Tax=Rippkaea orientalis (strain PCC 8801 / RF-1) TaxID=41431 RepID=B7K470_RIPO1|nr:metallophosphoesterase [Rippkaea orientalis]ACK67776.1 metallophosphoesterase [Rippkaea orientalis PCC 8801]